MMACHMLLRDHWYDIIVLNVHAPTKDETHNVKDSFCEELECVFIQLPKYT
jgi:hypothetical protein